MPAPSDDMSERTFVRTVFLIILPRPSPLSHSPLGEVNIVYYCNSYYSDIENDCRKTNRRDPDAKRAHGKGFDKAALRKPTRAQRADRQASGALQCSVPSLLRRRASPALPPPRLPRLRSLPRRLRRSRVRRPTTFHHRCCWCGSGGKGRLPSLTR